MFHHSLVAIPVGSGYYGNGTGPIFLDDVKCVGTEPGLGACDHKLFGSNNCGHNEDAGVMCLQGGEIFFYREVRCLI